MSMGYNMSNNTLRAAAQDIRENNFKPQGPAATDNGNLSVTNIRPVNKGRLLATFDLITCEGYSHKTHVPSAP
jgi:hypothetical protein